MRVTTQRPATTPSREEGASATLFVITLLSLLAVALLAIDGGSLFVSRRGQVADTDAGALAAARALVDDPCMGQDDVNDAADVYVVANDPATSRVGDARVDYRVGGDCRRGGTVTLETERDAALFFAPVFGVARAPTRVSTSVAYGQGSTFPGVRPIGICGLDPHYADEWAPFFNHAIDRSGYEAAIAATDAHYGALYPGFDAHPSYAAADVVHRVVFERLAGSDASDCPGAGGNFGWLDFDSGGGGTPELTRRIREGYEGEISLGGAGDGDEDCNVEDPGIVNCPPETGARGRATAPALNDPAVLCPAGRPASDCPQLLLVVYSDLTGNGTGARFDLASVVGLVLRGHDVGTGVLGGENYLDVEFTSDLVQGRVGSSPPGGTAPWVMNLCGVGGFSNCP